MSRVFITGAGGYIGSVLVGDLLNEGYTVIAYDSLMYSQHSLLQYVSHPNFTFIFGDVIDNTKEYQELILSCDFMLPLAAIVGAPATSRCIEYSRLVNYVSIVNLVDIVNSKNGKTKIIFPTTNSGYGTQTGEVYCTEDTPLQPISPYGRQKVDAERYLLDKCGDNVITLRLATVFGVSPRMRFDLLVNYSVYRAIYDKVLTVPRSIKDNLRNYIHVKDVSNIFLHCIKNFESMKGNSYNAGNDSENMSVWELSKIVQELTGCQLFITDHYKDPDLRNYIVSNEKLKRKGFEAKRTIIDEIPNLVKYFEMSRILNYGRGNYKNA